MDEGKNGTPGINKKGRLNWREIQCDNGHSNRMSCAVHGHADRAVGFAGRLRMGMTVCQGSGRNC
jgi:hypothetical protein